jgi:hypothetical protein
MNHHSRQSILHAAAATSDMMDEEEEEEEEEHIWVTTPLDSSVPLHRQLQKLDASFRCQICRGPFVNPVSLNGT